GQDQADGVLQDRDRDREDDRHDQRTKRTLGREDPYEVVEPDDLVVLREPVPVGERQEGATQGGPKDREPVEQEGGNSEPEQALEAHDVVGSAPWVCSTAECGAVSLRADLTGLSP